MNRAYGRLATWIRPGNSSRKCRYKSSNYRVNEILLYHRKMGTRNQSIPQITRTRTRCRSPPCSIIPRNGSRTPLHPRPGHHTDYLDEEVKAVDVMCSSLVTNPLNYGFLVTQATFLLKKNRPDLAVELARAAVNANPSEYATWAILTESYIAVNDFENVPSLTRLIETQLIVGIVDAEFLSNVYFP